MGKARKRQQTTGRPCAKHDPKTGENRHEVMMGSDNLLDVHRRFFERLHQRRYTPENLASNRHFDKSARLEALKRRRRAIVSEIEALMECRLSTSAQESTDRRRVVTLLHQRPYLRGHAKFQSMSSMSEDNPKLEFVKPEPSLTESAQGEASLPRRLFDYRNMIKTRAAYQLLGRTILYPCNHQHEDNKMLALRIDVSVHGSYIGCHYVFFELMSSVAKFDGDTVHRSVNGEQNTHLQLQFKQHTLPMHTAYMDILHKHLGNTLSLGPWPTDHINYHAILTKLQSCSAELQQLCFSYAVRKEALLFLQRVSSSSSEGMLFTVGQITANAACDNLSFVLHLHSPSVRLVLQVVLVYEESSKPLPTEVTLHILRPDTSGRSRDSAEPLSARDVSSDEADQRDLVAHGESLFRAHMVPKALQELATYMSKAAHDESVEHEP